MKVLMWPALHACLDLAYLVRLLSGFCKNPALIHKKLLKYVLQYISQTLDLCLKFDKETDTSNDVIGYTDSDFLVLKTNQKSTRGYFFILVRAAISHFSKL